jgi:hypothetical protein
MRLVGFLLGGLLAASAGFASDPPTEATADATSITVNGRMIGTDLLAIGEDSPTVPQAQPAVTPAQIEELERQVTALLEKLQELRRALQAQPETRALTPDEAVKEWRQNPQEPVTVEFGIGEAGWPDGPIPLGEDQLPPIIADWDGRLSNGGRFSLFLTAAAIRGFHETQTDTTPDRPVGYVDSGDVDRLCRQLKGKGVRVSGIIRANRPDDRYTDFSITVDDAANFRVNE